MTLNVLPTERSCIKVYSCEKEGPNSYQSKDMANVIVFAGKRMNGQTDRRTNGQAKSYMPPIYRWGGGAGGIKNGILESEN